MRLVFSIVHIITTHCDYKWHCVDHLQYEGYLEHLLPNVPLKSQSDAKKDFYVANVK